jgi:hypothetical protein
MSKCQSVVLRLERRRPRVIRRVPVRTRVRIGRWKVVLLRNRRRQASGTAQRRKPERVPISVMKAEEVEGRRMTE